MSYLGGATDRAADGWLSEEEEGVLITERMCHPHSLVLVSVNFYFGLLSPASFVASACLSFVSQYLSREAKLSVPLSDFHRFSSFLQRH